MIKSRLLPYILAGATGAIVSALIPLLLQPSHADTKLLPFQGRLTDAAGNAVGDGAKVVEFRLYDAPTGGNLKWAGEVHKLSVNGGLINTVLGTKASLGNVNFASPTFLQITVDSNGDEQITASDPPLLPRQNVFGALYASVAGTMQYSTGPSSVAAGGWEKIFSNGNPDTGYVDGNKIGSNTLPASAIASNDGISAAQLAPNSVGSSELIDSGILPADLATASVGSRAIADGTVRLQDLAPDLQASTVPVGAVLAFALSAPPTGWTLCDGRAVSRTDPVYSALFAAIGTSHGVGDGVGTFNLPDYRGRFLRGVDDPDGTGGIPAAGRDPDATTRAAMATGANEGDLVGSVQVDELRSHSHDAFFAGQPNGSGLGSGNALCRVFRSDNPLGNTGRQPSSAVGGNETRPQNAYVIYAIKL